ncbi:MAG: hypothetical protein M3547_03040 [Acidobacteriota bacterium]|nr:hypothetical protein [Acidobacteriota bacterium]
MRRAGWFGTTAYAAVLPLALNACASSKPVHALAAITGRNAALLEAHLSSLARQQQAISESRIVVVSRLHRETVKAEAEADRKHAFEREAGLGAPIDLSERWRLQTEESARKDAVRQESLAAAQKQLRDKQKAVQAPAVELLDTGKSLLASSEELTFKEHVAFLFGFASEVGADVKKARDDAKKAKASGDAKAKEAEKSTKNEP